MRLIINPNSEEGDEAFRSVINVPNRYIGQRFISEVEAYADSHDLHLYQGLKQTPVTVPYLKGYIRDFITLLDPLIKDAAGRFRVSRRLEWGVAVLVLIRI